MASNKANIFEFYNFTDASKYSIALFSDNSLSKNLPVRLSSLLQQTVSPDENPHHWMLSVVYA